MSAKLSQKAVDWLKASNCFDEVADDYLSVANSGIVILLSSRAVQDLNRQAADADGVEARTAHIRQVPGGAAFLRVAADERRYTTQCKRFDNNCGAVHPSNCPDCPFRTDGVQGIDGPRHGPAADGSQTPNAGRAIRPGKAGSNTDPDGVAPARQTQQEGGA